MFHELSRSMIKRMGFIVAVITMAVMLSPTNAFAAEVEEPLEGETTSVLVHDVESLGSEKSSGIQNEPVTNEPKATLETTSDEKLDKSDGTIIEESGTPSIEQGSVENKNTETPATTPNLVEIAPLASGNDDDPDEDVKIDENNEQSKTIVAQITSKDDAQYGSLKEAFDAAQSGDTIQLVSDISDMKTEDIANVSAGKTLIFDMMGHKITVASDFTGRPIANNGTLTVIGNGTIDASNGTRGYGAIRNDGTLIIENGRFIGNVHADGTAIRNGIGAVLTIYGGYFTGTGAIYNVGQATIYAGEFVTLACSACKTPWAYALNNRDEKGVSGTMEILPTKDSDVIVHGTQGALAAAGGAYVHVTGGTFYTEPCENNHGGSTFYALYVSGKGDDTATAVIDGGHFYTLGENACMYIENLNAADNGGDPGKSVVQINGGTFEQGNASKLCNFNGKAGGTLVVNGGTYLGSTASNDIAPYLSGDLEFVQNESGEWVIEEPTYVVMVGDKGYTTLAGAIAASPNGASIKVLDDIHLSIDDEGFAFTKDCTIDLDGHEIDITCGTQAMSVMNGANVVFKNGFISTSSARVSNTAFQILAGSSLTLQNIVFDTTSSALFPIGKDATVKVIDSIMHAPNAFAISTNANSAENYGVLIEVIRSTLTGNTPILINVPGELFIDDCDITGTMQAVVVRGGNATIKNSRITQDYPDDDFDFMVHYFDNRNWGDGNMVNLAAITVGNKHDKSYQYPSTVILMNNVISVTGYDSDAFPCLYAWANAAQENGVKVIDYENVFVDGSGDIVLGNAENGNIAVSTYTVIADGQYFESVEDALANSSATRVTLLTDIEKATVDRTVELDLAGHRIDSVTVVGNGKTDKTGVSASIFGGSVGTLMTSNKGLVIINQASIDELLVAADGRARIKGGTFERVSLAQGGNLAIENRNPVISNMLIEGRPGYLQIASGSFSQLDDAWMGQGIDAGAYSATGIANYLKPGFALIGVVDEDGVLSHAVVKNDALFDTYCGYLEFSNGKAYYESLEQLKDAAAATGIEAKMTTREVEFLDAFGNVVFVYDVEWGANLSEIAISDMPENWNGYTYVDADGKTYEFVSWDIDGIDQVTKKMSVSAMYAEKLVYASISFVNGITGENIIASFEYPNAYEISGDMIPTPQETIVVDGKTYRFVGWDEEPNEYKVYGDKTFTANYEEVIVQPENPQNPQEPENQDPEQGMQTPGTQQPGQDNQSGQSGQQGGAQGTNGNATVQQPQANQQGANAAVAIVNAIDAAQSAANDDADATQNDVAGAFIANDASDAATDESEIYDEPTPLSNGETDKETAVSDFAAIAVVAIVFGIIFLFAFLAFIKKRKEDE